MKVLALRRPDVCADCETTLTVGTKAVWDATSRTVRCLPCVQPAGAASGSATRAALDALPALQVVPPPEHEVPAALVLPPLLPPVAVAGASAQREFVRRSQRRETEIRRRHPRLGGLLLALSNDPASTRVLLAYLARDVTKIINDDGKVLDGSTGDDWQALVLLLSIVMPPDAANDHSNRIRWVVQRKDLDGVAAVAVT